MFDIQMLLRKNIRDMEPYSSARDEFQGTASVYLDANESPFNNGLNRYPDPLQLKLKSKISRLKNVFPEQIFLGNGSDEAIDLLLKAFCEPGFDNVVAMKPTYGMYKVCAEVNDINYIEVSLDKDFNLHIDDLLKAINRKTKLIFLCSPNNPTGSSLLESDILHLLDRFDGIVVLDEAYIDFSERSSLLSKLNDYPNLVILQTFSKAWGLAGIRLGMAFGSQEVIRVLNKIKYPYNINILTQEKAIENIGSLDQLNQHIIAIKEERQKMVLKLKELSFVKHVYPSDANFLLVKVDEAESLYQYLLKNEIIVRDRSKLALCEGCLRITIGTEKENASLMKALKQF
jgi:histidinol-phosphate aminotransferase